MELILISKEELQRMLSTCVLMNRTDDPKERMLLKLEVDNDMNHFIEIQAKKGNLTILNNN